MEAKGLAPTLFCAGGWYMDEPLAEALAELGLVDCSATAFRPGYLAHGEPRLSTSAPTRILLPSGARLLELPSTHSLGKAARAVLRPSLGPHVVHVYFHDTDLLDRSRRMLLGVALRVLARRARPTDLDTLAVQMPADTPRIPWPDVARL
jgi:hypothetical protein